MNKRILNRGIIFLLISILLVQASGTLTANASGLESNLEATRVPTPKSPGGLTFDRTPTYKWTKVSNATAYKYQLWKGTTVVYTKTTGASCGTLCVRTPGKVLGYNNYKWRVRAKVGGVWRPWSAFKSFAINNPNVPKPLSPAGTIFDETPTFKWTRASNVMRYRIQLYKGTTLIYTKTYGASCGSTTCSKTPGNVLEPGDYRWRVRVRKKNGVWKPWSAWKTFTNVVKYYDFDSTAPGWGVYGGTWAHEAHDSALTYASTGVDSSFLWSNIGYDPTPYSTVTFEVRMKRTGTDIHDTNRLIIRGEPTSVAPYDWANGYAFQYTNDKKFSVFNGSINLTDPAWQNPSDPNLIKPDDWNILKVVANGSSLKFYINGTLVWSGLDSTLTEGKVGIGHISRGNDNKLYVDWARISDQAPAPAADALMDAFVLPGTGIPGGSSTHSPSLP